MGKKAQGSEMCEHVIVPDNERVCRDTAIRLGWYFCIKCGEKFPSEKAREEESKKRYANFSLAKTQTPSLKPRQKRRQRKIIKTTETDLFEPELKDEPWIDNNGILWIISPNGDAHKG